MATKLTLVDACLACVHCGGEVAFGRDYCDSCDRVMAFGVARRFCGFCQFSLTARHLDLGFCGCGKPTVNSPQIQIRQAPVTTVVDPGELRESIDVSLKEGLLLALMAETCDRR